MADTIDINSDEDEPKLKDIPPIRDNPEMQSTTHQRRSSVANPHSMKYSDPGKSTDESSSNQSSTSSEYEDDNDDDDEEEQEEPIMATNEHSHSHNNINYNKPVRDPSISDFNDLQRSQYQPVHQQDDEEENKVEEIDPFARLGNKQYSVPLHVGQYNIAQINQQHRQKTAHPLSGINENDNENPYSPAALLDGKHLQRHSRSSSKHNRSVTMAAGFGRNQQFNPTKTNKKKDHRRNHSVSHTTEFDQVGPPKGPILTFLCTRVENRGIIQELLSDSKFSSLIEIHNNILDGALSQFHGFRIEQRNDNIYDYLCVFSDVYDAIRCAIYIQKGLNNYNWPHYYYQLERSTTRMNYVGKGKPDAFRGLRVGMALHTACVGEQMNKFDGGKESLSVEKRIFETFYEGTSVKLVKTLCTSTCGGELLATKAVSEALLRSKRGGDDVSVQRLGSADIVRYVELVELIPRDLPRRIFVTRPYLHKKKSIVQQVNDSMDGQELNKYDPFPKSHANANANDGDNEESDDENDGNNTTYEHSSDDAETQHDPKISDLKRRLSITQFHMDKNSNIEVLFDDNIGLNDDENEETTYLNVAYNDNNADNVSVNSYQSNYSQQSQSPSLNPPQRRSNRNKAHEIQKRKSQINMQNVMEFRDNDNNHDNLYDDRINKNNQKPKQKRSNKHRNKKKSRRRRHNDNEPGPSDSDFADDEANRLKKPREPRGNKKQERLATMVGNINFDPNSPHSPSSSVYSGTTGRASQRSGTGVRRVNPEQQLKLFKTRPTNLPNGYKSDDEEYTCLVCQKNKPWIAGVWRVPIWPSFDICTECANKDLQEGTSKKVTKNFNPIGIDAIHNVIVDPMQNPQHRKIGSNQPLISMTNSTSNLQDEHNKISTEMLENLRKELSQIIEKISHEKIIRLENLSKWSHNDPTFEDFRLKTIEEHKVTNNEINEWRLYANKLDEQYQRALRREKRKDTTPTLSDIESEEELQSNWITYDYKEDFSTIHRRLSDLNRLFWTEDEFFKAKTEGIKKVHNEKYKSLETQFQQNTFKFQQEIENLRKKLENKPDVNDDDGFRNHNFDEDYSDDDYNADIGKYEKYVPPTVKHIHEESMTLPDDENVDKVELLKNKLSRNSKMIDNYISTINSKNNQLKETEHKVAELQNQVESLQKMNDTDEAFAGMHAELQSYKHENAKLHNELQQLKENIYFGGYSGNNSNSNNENDNDSNNDEYVDETLIDEDKKEVIDHEQIIHEEQIKYKAAIHTINKLEEQIDELRDDRKRAEDSKMAMLSQTSTQMEEMRDDLENMRKQLQEKEKTIKQLIHINKEGYDPDAKEPEINKGDTQWPNPISSIKNGLLTFGRSKYSQPIHTLSDTKKQKIDLAISTSSEIERLRSIIRVLSNPQSQTAKSTQHRNRNGSSLSLSAYPGRNGIIQ